jgi:hypothetical protein
LQKQKRIARKRIRMKFDRKKPKGGWNLKKKTFEKWYQTKQVAIKKIKTKFERLKKS